MFGKSLIFYENHELCLLWKIIIAPCAARFVSKNKNTHLLTTYPLTTPQKCSDYCYVFLHSH